MKGRLVRQIPISLVDVSLSGCNVRLDDWLSPGADGQLSVRLSGKDYSDVFQVVRCTMLNGSNHSYTLGVQFSWGTRPGHASLRSVLPLPARASLRHKETVQTG